jgi:hypothetical protein
MDHPRRQIRQRLTIHGDTIGGQGQSQNQVGSLGLSQESEGGQEILGLMRREQLRLGPQILPSSGDFIDDR